MTERTGPDPTPESVISEAEKVPGCLPLVQIFRKHADPDKFRIFEETDVPGISDEPTGPANALYLASKIRDTDVDIHLKIISQEADRHVEVSVPLGKLYCQYTRNWISSEFEPWGPRLSFNIDDLSGDLDVDVNDETLGLSLAILLDAVKALNTQGPIDSHGHSP